MKRKRRTVREKPERQRRRRLLIESKKLNPKEERALAEKGMIGEEATPSRDDLVRSALAVCGSSLDIEHWTISTWEGDIGPSVFASGGEKALCFRDSFFFAKSLEFNGLSRHF